VEEENVNGLGRMNKLLQTIASVIKHAVDTVTGALHFDSSD
jgi:hypothetical protein